MAVLVAVFLITNVIGGKKETFRQRPSSLGIQEVAAGDIVDKDTDGDGIADWEEFLWGTDPDNTDTDGDGIPDNIEIEQKRKESQPDIGQDEEQGLNETEIFARELFATLISLKQSGNLNPETLSQLGSMLGQNLLAPPPATVENKYKLNDLNIVSASNSTLEAYFRDMNELTQEYYELGLGDELGLMANVVQTQDEDSLLTLARISDGYKSFGEELKDLEVPQNVSSAHLSLLNSSIKVGESLGALTAVSENPLVALRGISLYKTYSMDFIDAFETLQDYFEEIIL